MGFKAAELIARWPRVPSLQTSPHWHTMQRAAVFVSAGTSLCCQITSYYQVGDAGWDWDGWDGWDGCVECFMSSPPACCLLPGCGVRKYVPHWQPHCQLWSAKHPPQNTHTHTHTRREKHTPRPLTPTLHMLSRGGQYWMRDPEYIMFILISLHHDITYLVSAAHKCCLSIVMLALGAACWGRTHPQSDTSSAALQHMPLVRLW